MFNDFMNEPYSQSFLGIYNSSCKDEFKGSTGSDEPRKPLCATIRWYATMAYLVKRKVGISTCNPDVARQSQFATFIHCVAIKGRDRGDNQRRKK
jgi:hypothetical protein